MLSIVADDGRIGRFDVSPYLQYEAFGALRDQSEFVKVVNGGYFVEWDCGADLSADTIEARWGGGWERDPAANCLANRQRAPFLSAKASTISVSALTPMPELVWHAYRLV